MAKYRPALALLAVALACANADAQTSADADGFKHPLSELKFDPGLDQHEFERSTLNALEIYDPLESWNRHIYHFNHRFDEWVFLPAVDGYHYVTPTVVQQGVSNFFSNLDDLPNLANSLLQFKGKRAMDTTARLLFNTILGLAGLWDPATLMGLPKQPEDFGQTLGFYGTPAGPYLIIPILGPSNLRDASGTLVDALGAQQANFLNVAEASRHHVEITLLSGIDQRANTDFRYGQLNSPFEYEKIRFIYTEGRKLQIAE